MKKWNRYAASFLALIGLIFLFFPVFRAGETGITVVELMAYWKKKSDIGDMDGGCGGSTGDYCTVKLFW